MNHIYTTQYNGPTVSYQKAVTYIPDNVPNPKSGRRNSKDEYIRRKIFFFFSSRIGLVPREMQQYAHGNRSAFKLVARVPCHLPFGVELFVTKSPGNKLMINIINNVNERPETYH